MKAWLLYSGTQRNSWFYLGAVKRCSQMCCELDNYTAGSNPGSSPREEDGKSTFPWAPEGTLCQDKAKESPVAVLVAAGPGWPAKGTLRQRLPIEQASPDVRFPLPVCCPEKATSLLVRSFHPNELRWRRGWAGAFSLALICFHPGPSKPTSSM